MALAISLLGIFLMILSILLFPTIKFKKIGISTYWIIMLITAIILVVFKFIPFKNITNKFMENSAVNPLKILILFISMTILSIFLDEVGFFRYIAVKSSRILKKSQIKLFCGFYFLLSFLTVFTSNDIIILTFTPFICYFCKNAKINPIPYLVLEFVAANTFSMILIIGNPTNIYLASAFNIKFLTYFSRMIIPTLFASITSFTILFLLFKKELKKEILDFDIEEVKLNKPLLIIGLIHLSSATIFLAISGYIGLEMWYIAFGFMISLLIFNFIYLIVNKRNRYLGRTLLRAPWALIPFVCSMFIVVLCFSYQGYIEKIQKALNRFDEVFSYGLSSAIIANLINNIPMSVFFSEVLEGCELQSLYSVIVASNVAAFLTPIGALAGIMWMNLLKSYEVKYSFKKYILYGMITGIPTLLVSLVGVYITFLLW